MRKDTRIHLVEELEKLPKTSLIEFIIKEAKAGEYHDYKNEKYVCGKVALVGYLDQAGLADLSSRVKDGEFDEEADEQDREMLRSYLPQVLHDAFKLNKH